MFLLGGGLCPRESLSGGVSIQWVSLSRSICLGGLCPWGSLSMGVSVQGGLCPGDFYWGDPLDRDPMDRDPIERVTSWMETPSRQRSPWTETPSQKAHGTTDRDPSIKNMGLGSETGSDMIHRHSPVNRMTHFRKYYPAPNFVCVR